MSGHSKWSQIKHQKGAADRKRGMTFTKLSNAITIAVKHGGGIGDPAQNFHLRLLIEKARKENMPKVNIDRAVQRGQGKGEDAVNLEEVIYEGFGSGQVAIIVQVTTDNRQRSYSSIRSIFTKFGGSLAGPGSVSYMFSRQGILKVPNSKITLDQLTDFALELDCLDIEDMRDAYALYTPINKLHQIKEELEKKGISIIDAQIIFKPTTIVTLQDKKIVDNVLQLVSALEANDDIQSVAANFEIPDKLMDF